MRFFFFLSVTFCGSVTGSARGVSVKGRVIENEKVQRTGHGAGEIVTIATFTSPLIPGPRHQLGHPHPNTWSPAPICDLLGTQSLNKHRLFQNFTWWFSKPSFLASKIRSRRWKQHVPCVACLGRSSTRGVGREQKAFDASWGHDPDAPELLR